MRKQMSMMVAAAVAMSVAFVGVTFAAGEPTEPIPTAKQTKLLDKFGDEGIDADGDGVLTHEEVKAFFAEKYHPDDAGMHGLKEGKHQGMRGCFGHGMGKGKHHGMMGRMDYGEMTEEHIAKMLKHHPEADADGDGLLSEGEFETFRAQRKEEHRAMVLEHHPDADTDDDGVLSEVEFEAFHAQRMEEHRAKMLEHHPEADTDGDGTLSDEEARSFMGDHPDGFGFWHDGPAGHKGKGHGGCAGHKDKGHGWFGHGKDKGHGGRAHHEGKDHDGHTGHEHQ
ncbi:MAG: EF-hand domain-containing protein [Planctomycetota bacterium]|jgi:Ca2+-binding EF-hand superfamily protein